jgi:threonine/homoserine/homoserine lactone efflux protein
MDFSIFISLFVRKIHVTASIFIRGLIIGFSIAAPVGPIGVLCIRRTLAEGRAAGFVSGIGAATADAIYGSMAAFGLTALSTFLVSQQMWLKLAGGLFLCVLGIRTFLAKPTEQSASPTSKGLVGSYISTFFLTLTNPMTILSFVAIFAGLGAGSSDGNYLTAAWMVAGVFTGSALWWLLLSEGVGVLKVWIQASGLIWINRISGTVIFIFGILAAGSAHMVS